jgi:hypothetical protein
MAQEKGGVHSGRPQDLSQGYTMQEFFRVHQLPALDQFLLQQRHHRKTAAEADGAKFEEEQGQRSQ